MTQRMYGDGPRVVVGIDGSPPARAAAEFAVREARLRGARLVAVTALGVPELAHFDPYSVRRHPKADILARAEETVAAALFGLDTEGLDVRVVVTTDTPARALVERSAFADLLVVGSRGRGDLSGLVLGSVSQHCVLHARCPVAVVRSQPVPASERDSAEPAERSATPGLSPLLPGQPVHQRGD